MRWVKLTLAPVVRASWLLRMSRLTSSSRAGTVRTLVAVGTPRLASMLATIREAAPRSGVASSFTAAIGASGAGAAAAAGAAGSRRRSPGRSGRGLRGLDGGAGNGAGAVVGEELAPALADRVGVGQEAVVHVVDQPCVGAERASRATELGHGPTLPAEVGFLGRVG